MKSRLPMVSLIAALLISAFNVAPVMAQGLFKDFGQEASDFGTYLTFLTIVLAILGTGALALFVNSRRRRGRGV